ncbi:MAG: BBP7 family outer membrane beta-barrel protein [Gemmataceae bacterium]
MIRFRGKVLGLGLALAAAPLAAQQPALLPPTVRSGEWSAGAPADAVWFPARGSTPALKQPPTVLPPPPAVVPPAVVKPVQGETEPVVVGPRVVAAEMGPLPSIPALPDVAPQPFPVASDLPPMPPIPTAMPTRPTVQPQPAPPPKAVEPLPIPPLPKATDPVPTPSQPKAVEPPPIPPTKSAEPLPPPRVTVPPSDAPITRPAPQPELPTAPPELLVPSGYGLPARHTAFGSDPVRISRDYPSLHDLFRLHHDGTADGADEAAAAPADDRGYVRLELLLWWVNPQRIPVLASTSTTGGLGFIGEPGTALLLGSGRTGDNFRTGLRVRGGWWCDEDGHLGIDGSFFFLGRDTTSTAFDSGTTPTITRPFFAANDGGFEFGERVARPGFSRGSLEVDATSALYGFDANIRHALCRTCGFRDEVFVGYRHLALNESLTVTENIVALPGNTADPAGTRIVVQDQFKTTNRFNGGQVGYAAERNWGRLSLDGRVSVALGNTHQTVEVSGFQQRQRPGEDAVFFPNGGLLAAGPNIGRFTDDRFTVVPEFTLNLGYWLTPSVKAYVGYNALYWSNVVRPGDQVDRTIDVTFIPNPPINPATGQVPAFSGLNRPAVPFKQDHLWVNGIQFGAEWRW